MLSDHKQCIDCIYAQWGYKDGGAIKRFVWCNHLDRTGEKHVVENDICQSKVTKGESKAPKRHLYLGKD